LALINSLTFTICTFINQIGFGASPSDTPYGFALAVSVDPMRGYPITSSFSNCQFYGIASANWTIAGTGPAAGCAPVYYGGLPTNGGGNSQITSFPHQTILDPVGGAALNMASMLRGMVDGGAIASFLPATRLGFPRMTSNPPALDYSIAASPTIGAVVGTLTPYDATGVALTGTTISLLNNSGGAFSINSGGVITVAANGLTQGQSYVSVQTIGTGIASGATVASTITIGPEWVPIPIG
jgi:hypothetical protein